MADPADAPSIDDGPNAKEAKRPDGKLRQYWKEIEAYNKCASDWKEQGQKIVKMYLDQHRTQASPRRFALLWSNIETLRPVIYAKLPNVVCSRRYKDPDPIGRTGAELLERATNCTFDLGKVDEVFRMVRDDRLLPGRGQAWVRYEADIDETDAKSPKVNSERVCVDHVEWTDFGHNVAGKWKDVWLAWRVVHKNREEVTKRFKAEVAAKLNYETRKTDDEGKAEAGEQTARIYEVWDKRAKTVNWMSKDCPDFLDDSAAPPLNFRDFFPCPEPCYGSKASKSLIPTPDYRYYQDQAQEIDDLTQKIATLTDYLMLRGFVPSGPSGDGGDAIRTMIQVMQDGITKNNSVFVPVEAWQSFSERGGAKGLIEWMPLEIVIEALKGAIEARNQLVQDVYQITGISDIQRGQSDPNETLGAQELKSQNGSRRVKTAKDDVARFTKEVGQLVAEVIAEQFSPQTIADMTGYAYVPSPPVQPGMGPPIPMMGQQMPQQPMGMPQAPQQSPESPSQKSFDDKVLKLIRDDRMRGFLIDIETDSTVQPDEDAEKQRRTEFITAIGTFFTEAGPVMQEAPALAPMFKEMLLFAVRGFRAGRSLEEVIERSMDQAGQAMQAKQGQPDPAVAMEQQKAQAQMQIAQQKAQLDTQAQQAEMQGKQAMMQQELQIKQAELQIKREEMELKRQELQMQLQADQQRMAMEGQQMQQKAAYEQQAMERKAQVDEHSAELSQQSAEAKHDMGLEIMAEKAKQAKARPQAAMR